MPLPPLTQIQLVRKHRLLFIAMYLVCDIQTLPGLEETLHSGSSICIDSLYESLQLDALCPDKRYFIPMIKMDIDDVKIKECFLIRIKVEAAVLWVIQLQNLQRKQDIELLPCIVTFRKFNLISLITPLPPQLDKGVCRLGVRGMMSGWGRHWVHYTTSNAAIHAWRTFSA